MKNSFLFAVIFLFICHVSSLLNLLKGKALVSQYFDYFKTNSQPKKDVEYDVQCKCFHQSFDEKVKTEFIGCASHHFNLSMKSYQKTFKNQLIKINEIMLKLKYMIPEARLRACRHLKAKTRWSSLFSMIQGYTKFDGSFLFQNLMRLMNYCYQQKINEILVQTAQPRICQLNLQKKDTSLSDVRGLFDTIS